jgi:hypothetical protein
MLDNNKCFIQDGSILQGSTRGIAGEHYWNFYETEGSYEMIACTYGYVHNLIQDDFSNLKLVGSFDKFHHLLECD